jgi:hypothetical protein
MLLETPPTLRLNSYGRKVIKVGSRIETGPDTVPAILATQEAETDRMVG